LHAREYDRNQERIFVSGILDCRVGQRAVAGICKKEQRVKSLTEVDGICVEHGQTDKLLNNLRPSGDDESEEVSALENSPLPKFFVFFRKLSFHFNSGGHNFLSLSQHNGLIEDNAR
jgi:hypothetical protein